jgi:hypothetical protein
LVTSGNLSVNLSTYLPLAGSSMDANATVDFSDTTTGTVSEVGGYGFAVSSVANVNLYANVLFDRVAVSNATGSTSLKPTGVEFPDLTLQTTAGISAALAASTYQTLAGMSSYLTTSTAASTYYLQTNPSGFITSSALTPYLLSSTAASTYQTLAGMSSYLTTATAATTYYPLSGNPSSFLVAADITGKANLASPTFTGVPLSTTAAVDTNTTQIATTAYVVAQAGSATPLVDGTAAVGTSLRYARQDHVHPSDTTRAGLSIANTFTATNSFSGTISHTGTTGSLGSGSIAMTISLASGLTPSGSTKTVNIGNNSQTGSTTNITIGSTLGTSTTTLQGTTNATTAAVDTNSVRLATTAFVVAQAASATPLVNGTAAVGTSLRYARADHVHGTDTTRAPLASPTFTGTPTLPTGTIATTQTAGNNTTAVATTAFVRADNNVKAWVNFNGTGTVAIRASMNVSSITDNGTADYTVNFTTAISDANYATMISSNFNIGNNGQWAGGILQYPSAAPTTTAVRLQQSGIPDFTYVSVTILR